MVTPPLILEEKEYDNTGDAEKLEVFVKGTNGSPRLDVSTRLEAYWILKFMETIDLNLSLPSRGIDIPPGDEKEYLVDTATVFLMVRVSVSDRPVDRLNF